MAKRTSKLPVGAIIGMVILAVVAIGGGVGLFLASHNTDSRSQASADHVARISLTPRTPFAKGISTQLVGVDISQMTAGTTVASFYTNLAIGAKGMVLGETTLGSEGLLLPRSKCSSDRDCRNKNEICYQPSAPCPKGRVCKPTVGYCMPRVAPTAVPPVKFPTKVPLTIAPTRMVPTEPTFPTQAPTMSPNGDILATSDDGMITISGVGPYKAIKDLRVLITQEGDNYYVYFGGSVNTGDTPMQQAFMKNMPLLLVSIKERPMGYSETFIKATSIKGYLPRINALVELTQSTTGPTKEPPQKVTPTRPDSKPSTGVSVWPTKGNYPTVYPTGPRVVSPSPTRRPQPPTSPPYPSYEQQPTPTELPVSQTYP